jgi:hypothetical protein
MVESRIFWFRFIVELRLMPMLEKVVLQLTDDVRVDCVIDWGLYIEFRLLGSKFVVAKFTLADSVLYGLALAS